MTKKALRNLLQEMTLEEKIGQLVQLSGSCYKQDAVVTGTLKKSGGNSEVLTLAGSTLGISGAEQTIAIQKEYLKNSLHKIPLLFMMDVIHGFRTIFPCPLGQGAAFSPDLVAECAAVAAKEAAVAGIHVTFAPMADLVKDARWGRVLEATGEDPWLNGEMAAAMVEGFQGKSIGDQYQVAACVKHFAAYGATEGGREYQNVELSEHTLREQYLPAYQRAIEAGCEMVMTAFHTWNGVPCTGNAWLLQKILRKEMRFSGVVISDWGSVGEMVTHGYCTDKKEAARKAFQAGVDVDMCANAYAEHLAEWIQNGEITEKELDRSVLRVLELKNRLGLFEHPYKDADPEKERQILLCEEHRKLARKAVAASLVLLENRQLPLGKEQKIAFIGPYVKNASMSSTWAVSGQAEDEISIQQAASEVFSPEKVFFATGCTMLDNGTSAKKYEYYSPDWEAENNRLGKEAVEIAAKVDVVVLCVGEDARQSGEAASRANITLPEVQMELVKKIYEVNRQIVAIVFGGRPLELSELRKYAETLLLAWLPGTEGGHGIMDVLTGRVSPCGKLPMSIPYCTGQLPVSYMEYNTGRPRYDKNKKDYTCGYLDVPNDPLYPFGYGLTYTKFEISDVKLDRKIIGQKDKILASVEIRNIGNSEGTETLQLYLQDVTASCVRPKKELKGIKKIYLQAGKQQKVTFEISESMLMFYGQKGKKISESGEFRVWISNSSVSGNPVSFWLEK